MDQGQEKVAKIYHKRANARNDRLHKASTTISENHALVVMEDLKVRKMSASASGTMEAKGKNVRRKPGLYRSILDQGWYKFRVFLDYKLRRRGGELILVAPHYTSQKCPCCGSTRITVNPKPRSSAFSADTKTTPT